MKISVIIPARNEAKNIYNVIEQIDPSVFEIIVIDGNSIDSTFDVAKSHPKCTKVFKQLSVFEVDLPVSIKALHLPSCLC